MRLLLILASLFTIGQLNSQTIAEKKAGFGSIGGEDLTPEMKTFLLQVNSDLNELQSELKRLYQEVAILHTQQAPTEFYAPLLQQVNAMKRQIVSLQEDWQQMAASSSKEADYALWNQPESTIGQLVNDFGSYNYLYVTSPEISAIKISLDSNLPIPRGSWEEVLEFILHQSGIGIRQLNPYVRELYILRNDLSRPRIITSRREELPLLPPSERIVYVLSPDSSEIKRVWYFLDKFINTNTTALQMIGRDILIIGNVSEVQEMLKIYDFVSTHRGDKEYKAVKIQKVDVEEMAKVLSVLFESIMEEPDGDAPNPFPTPKPTIPEKNKLIEGKTRSPEFTRVPPPRANPQALGVSSSLKIIALKDIAQALFLVGTKEEISKAEEIIKQVEDQVGATRRKEIVWYNVKHSDPEELAQILVRIYELMLVSETGIPEEGERFVSDAERSYQRREAIQNDVVEAVAAIPKIPLGVVNDTGFLSSANYLINPEDRKKPRPPPNIGRDNFLVDPKTGSLIMVIESDLVTDMRNLIKRLDVPKRMVQIEVMLVEQVITNANDIGLNLLKIGCMASQTNATDFLFNVFPRISGISPGITDFLISRSPHGNIPAYDLAYHFLISRDDVRINASPSVLAMNETEASIEFELETSVSVGTFVVPNAGTATLQESFARARYGISIDVVPTIHMHDPNSPFDDGIDYITLESDVKFETFTSDINSRPNVVRRVLKNQARIADGQTVVIGGFRRKDAQDKVTSIPFIGEIPGFGKLFSNTTMNDTSVETFLFLTAKIASDPLEDLEYIKMEEMARRPGDLPYFMKALREAQEAEQNRHLYHTMQMLFGREPERYVDKEACEYHGK
ncbi:MAG: type II secretion system protein GspD [Parachlamydiaceae bacterium]